MELQRRQFKVRRCRRRCNDRHGACLTLNHSLRVQQGSPDPSQTCERSERGERSERAPRFGLAPVTTAEPASEASVVTGVGPKARGGRKSATLEVLGRHLVEELAEPLDLVLLLGGHREACLLYTSPSPRD